MIITKDKSTFIKGIVIIMMIFLHLFNGNHTDLCANLLYIGDIPFSKWLSKACGPVGFFLLLSGYGLAYTFFKKGISFIQQAKRIFKLYVHYWLVLFIFISIGSCLIPDRYPGGFLNIVLNACGWESSYDAPMWFLFPYCLVSLASSVIIRTIERIGNSCALLLTGVIYCIVCYMISRYGALYLFNNMLIYHPILFLQFLYPFTLGVVFYRLGSSKWSMPSWQALVSILVLVSLVASFGNSIVYMVYVPLLVFLLCQLSFPRWLEQMLMELGRKSMPMWMVHYLFQPYVYSLRYPILILGGAILISYLTAIPIMWCAKMILKTIKS